MSCGTVFGVSTPCTILRCFFRYVDWLNTSAHSEQWNGFAPVWTIPCRDRLPGRVNLFLQTVHSYGFAPVCMLEWRSSSPDRPKQRPHSGHLYGFSPVWLRLWTISSLFVVNRFWHTEHWNSFSPLWNFIWTRRCSDRPNDFPHVAHWNGFSPLCIFPWRTSCPWQAKRLSQSVHLYGRSPEWVREWIVSALRLSKCFPHCVHRCLLFCTEKWLPPAPTNSDEGASICFVWCHINLSTITTITHGSHTLTNTVFQNLQKANSKFFRIKTVKTLMMRNSDDNADSCILCWQSALTYFVVNIQFMSRPQQKLRIHGRPRPLSAQHWWCELSLYCCRCRPLRIRKPNRNRNRGF